MTGRDLSCITLKEACDGLDSGTFSACELTEACLQAIADRDVQVNSFLSLEPEQAIKTAEKCDRQRDQGKRETLLGVPLAHKDMFYRTGRISSCGSRIMQDFPANVTATVLERLDATGAIEIGALNMSEFAAGPTGHNAHFGHARNPWNTDYITGGSSSGSAAAVAARLCFGALGSDTGASIRVPAACCGVVGLKPTYGRVSRYGVMPRSWSNDCVGPIARTAEDCAMLMQAIAGADPNDPSCLNVPVPDYMATMNNDITGLRIGIPTRHYSDGVDGETQGLLAASRRVLEQAGCQLIEVALPDPTVLYALGETVAKGEAATIHSRWIAERPQDYSKQVRERLETGLALPTPRYLEALSLRASILQEFHESALAKVDALHLPILGMPVPGIEETDLTRSTESSVIISSITQFTRPINYLGLPALSVPCGFSANGLPVGFQLVGRPFDEDLLLAIGHGYQKRTQWHIESPPLVA